MLICFQSPWSLNKEALLLHAMGCCWICSFISAFWVSRFLPALFLLPCSSSIEHNKTSRHFGPDIVAICFQFFIWFLECGWEGGRYFDNVPYRGHIVCLYSGGRGERGHFHSDLVHNVGISGDGGKRNADVTMP